MNQKNQTLVWDDVQKQAKSALDAWKKRNNQLTSSSILPSAVVDEYVADYTFLDEQLQNELCEILENWHKNHSLNESQQDSFRKYSEYLLRFSKNSSEGKDWFTKHEGILNLAKENADDIASQGYYLQSKGNEDPNLESFDTLIQAFSNSDCAQLLDVIVQCISNNSYKETLLNLSKNNVSTLNLTQHFLLVTCPNYILTCDRDYSHLQKLFKNVLQDHNELLTYFLPNIDKWTDAVILCLLYLIQLILSDSDSLPYEEKHDIQNALVTIFLKSSVSGPNNEEEHMTVIYTVLYILVELIRSDSKLLSELKKYTASNNKLLVRLEQLADDNRDEKAQLHAFELLCFLVPEEEFTKINNSAKVTKLFMKNFNEAREDTNDRTVEDLMQGLKGLVKTDEIKQQVVEQNGLPSIIQYTKETTDDPTALEVVYALAFNQKAKTTLNEDREFIDHVEKLKQSDNPEVANAAHGIMWKLEDEDKLMKEAEDKKSDEQSTEKGEKTKDDEKNSDKTKGDEKQADKTKDDEKKHEQYDMMISYCWAQKEMCHRINDRLEKDGYSVWLDRDEMRGSIVESMAEAVENSHCILICMSSDYKASTNCQAEAEYAFNRKSKMLPLKVEKDYQPDGWLGLMAGSKLYVDFGGKEDDDEFEEAYKLLIAELHRQETDEHAEEEKKKSEPDSSATEPESTPKETEPPKIQTVEYLTAGPVTMWTNVHVNEFLSDNQLDPLLPVCKAMDGEILLDFHEACKTTPALMYPIINKNIEHGSVPLDIYFKFIRKLKKYLPPPPPPSKAYFRYDFTYDRSTINGEPTNTNSIN